eukprot:CAMPEP_0195535802 /NCGR_PEP_ID=MMETSP0794_2-20130614/44970_1 /TAXON_ID=515487 /ORGANISM="Stephanopyxis turris, Strain CCMP 815" /LENGTH=39 /DNA_ID= /DNA_START= /DNA_END= /DNA_ORIENTATION=
MKTPGGGASSDACLNMSLRAVEKLEVEGGESFDIFRHDR